MQIDDWAADALAGHMAGLLAGGHVDVFDGFGDRLARCRFADPAFAEPEGGAVAAHPFPPAIGERDGRPLRFEAFAANGDRVFAGSAGYKDDQPPPEMAFRTRMILEGADVLIESFVFSVVRKSGEGDE